MFEGVRYGHTSGLGVTHHSRALESQRVHEHHDKSAAIGNRVICRIVSETETGLIIGDGTHARARQRLEISFKNIGG